MQKTSISYDSDFVKTIKKHSKHMLKKYPKRFKHIKRVAERAKSLAKIHKIHLHKVLVAAYLHDITKKWTTKEHTTYLNTEEAKLYNNHPYYLHAASASKYAKKSLGIRDKKVLNAIYYHSTGRANMSMIEKIVIVSDMCEPKRKRWNPNKLFKIAKKDLELALVQSLHLKMQHFIETKKEPHRNLKEAYDFYKEYTWTK